jgi:hypothetical protein
MHDPWGKRCASTLRIVLVCLSVRTLHRWWINGATGRGRAFRVCGGDEAYCVGESTYPRTGPVRL